MKRLFATSALALSISLSAHADSFTQTSPSGGALPSAVSPVGGIVTDLVGINGTRVVAQVAASTEYIGTEPISSTPSVPQIIVIGAQSGITSSVLASLGGGLQSASFRISLYDGDTQLPDFDHNENFLLVGATGAAPVGTITSTSNGISFGNFSSVATEETNSTGSKISNNNGYSTGFGNDILDTGFFSSDDSATLAGLYGALVTASAGNQLLQFQLRDNTPGNNVADQYYDFTEGIDASLVNVGSGPVVAPVGATPEPSSLILLSSGLCCAAFAARKKLRHQ